jgi:cytoplasmic iron level regulating protein YaaA (DUF328/UPF0246 family)
VLRTLFAGQVGELMSISDPLAVLNVARYASWTRPCDDARQAVMSFNGDVYTGLDARTLEAGAGYVQDACASCPACTACCVRST